MTHGYLTGRARRWLANTAGCAVVLEDPRGVGECPDAIGWRFGVSTLVECKVSRSDWLRDRKKVFRFAAPLGLGVYRYVMAPPGVVAVGELLPGWGLLEVAPRIVRRVVAAQRHAEWNALGEARLLTAELRKYHAQGLYYAPLGHPMRTSTR